MSTATLPIAGPVHNGMRLLTIADVAALPSHLPSGEVRYELHDGSLVVMAPPEDIHARRQARFVSYLFLHGEQQGHGEVRGDVAVVLHRYPDQLVAPDAAFLTTAQLPPHVSPEGYLVTIPELIVEVRSKNDTQPEIDQKVNDYLTAGAVLVWIADPVARTVTVYQSNQLPVVLTTTDVLTAAPLFSGFAVPVSDLLPV